jgi:hypothetical protein
VNAISKALLLFSLVVLFSGAKGAVQALTMSGEAKGKTCSQLAAELRQFQPRRRLRRVAMFGLQGLLHRDGNLQ